jgi:hypothetical protein
VKTAQFKSEIVQIKGRGFVAVEIDPNTMWGTKTRHFVTGTVNGRTIRGDLEKVDGKWMLPAGPVWRRDNGVEIGDAVEVELTPEGPMGDRLSPDVAAALDSAPDAKAFFEGLATFYRKNYIRWIESAKRPETRMRRIAEMIAQLQDGKREK